MHPFLFFVSSRTNRKIMNYKMGHIIEMHTWCDPENLTYKYWNYAYLHFVSNKVNFSLICECCNEDGHVAWDTGGRKHHFENSNENDGI